MKKKSVYCFLPGYLKAQLRPYHAFGACCELLHFSLLRGTLQEIRGSGVVGFGFFGGKVQGLGV